MARLPLSSIVQIAARNLLRNPRRTAITLSTLVVGIGCLTFLSALNRGWLDAMKDNFILGIAGHVQVHAAPGGSGPLLPAPGTVGEALADTGGIRAWTLRLQASALASTATAAASAAVLAVEPSREPLVSRLGHCLGAGRWLAPGSGRDLVVGAALARQLEAVPGDRVVLMGQALTGDVASEAFRLRGVLCPIGPEVDRTLVLMPLERAREWLGAEGGATHAVVRAATHDAADTVAAALAARLPPAYEVRSWREVDPMVRQWVAFSEAYGLVVIAIVVALVVLEVLNVMLMAVHERRRELAVMQAVGTGAGQLFGLLLAEALLLVGLGALLGYGAGAGAVHLAGHHGIDLSRFAEALEFFYMSPVIHPALTTETELRLLATTLITALLAGLYPALKAARLDPAETLRKP